MSIDWFTLVAQILNFILLVWLLKRFLYKPILDAIDARENLVASQINDAKVQLEKAEIEQNKFQEKNEKFDTERSILLVKMEKDVEDEKRKRMEAVRKDAEALRIQLQENLKSQEDSFKKVFISEAQKNFFSISQKMLKHLASAELEDQMLTVFIRELKTIAPAIKQEFIAAVNKGSDPVVVRSAFELSTAHKAIIEAAISEQLVKVDAVQYSVSPDQISGIELSSRDYKFSWTIAEYLKTLEAQTMEIVAAKSGESKL
jgi:F-type H+-transporting ATPase subunit b